MPLANIKVIAGIFSDAEKQQMIKNVSEAIIAVEGEPMRAKTTVMIEEIKSGDWAEGRNLLSTEIVRNVRAS